MHFLLAVLLLAQNFSHRGFIESRLTAYPEEVPHDRAHAFGEMLARYEGFYTATGWMQFAGALDFRTDTHHQVERDFTFSWTDRTRKRPVATIRRLSGLIHTGPVTIELGKQFVRWGKADIVTPTDRFAPRDFLAVVENDFLPITAARVTYERGIDTVEAVWAPTFTPSRIPLYDQRWTPAPPNVTIEDAGADFPDTGQAGIRWNRTGAIETAVSVYRGFNHLPSFVSFAGPAVGFAAPGPIEFRVPLRRFYPQMLMVGGDIAVPLRWLTVKGEVGHFSSNDTRPDEYLLYVVQLERQSGEWFFVGGYAGEVVTRDGTQPVTFAPDRGLTRTLLGRAGYTIDANRSIAFEAAARDNGDGTWAKFEYSHAFGQHWRVTGTATLIRGEPTDFLGQYRDNSYAAVVLRYSF